MASTMEGLIPEYQVSARDSENVMKNIVSDLVRLCSKRGVIISRNCATYLVNLMVKNPEFCSHKGPVLTKEDIKELEELCFSKCLHPNTLATLHMQVYFSAEVVTCDQLIHENRENIKKRLEPILKDFLHKFPQTPEDVERAYHTLVTLIILWSGMGGLTNSLALRETAVALQSVFSAPELSDLFLKPLVEQEKQIKELTAIVSGVRLFNRECKRGGQYIDDLPEILSRDVDAVHGTLHTLMQKLIFKIILLTKAVENHCCKIKSQYITSPNANQMKSKKSRYAPGGGSASSIDGSLKLEQAETIKEALITARQYEFFLRSLVSQVESVKSRMNQLKGKLRSSLAKLHNTVLFRTAIPTIEIYPQFIDLYEVWTEFQNEISVINYLSSVTWNLNTHAQVLDSLDDKIIKQMIGQEYEEKQKTQDMFALTQDMILECDVIDYEETSEFEAIPIELNGFCIWCLVYGNGALIPGNPKIGLCKHNQFYYSFSSVNAAIEFGQNPARYIHEACSVIKKKSELINLIKIHEIVSPSEEKIGFMGESRTDTEIQTELHPIDSHIEPNYSWNEWDYRRKALQMVNIRKCLTKSVHTGKSHWRQDKWTNVSFPHHEKYSQTKRESASNVPQPRRYAFGLRGREQGEKFHMVDLTRPVDK